MSILGWLGWFIAVLELAVIVLWWKGGALDTAKADQALSEEAKQVQNAAGNVKDKISSLFKPKPKE